MGAGRNRDLDRMEKLYGSTVRKLLEDEDWKGLYALLSNRRARASLVLLWTGRALVALALLGGMTLLILGSARQYQSELISVIAVGCALCYGATVLAPRGEPAGVTRLRADVEAQCRAMEPVSPNAAEVDRA